LGANGGYTYTPAKDVNGSDSFTFRASDGALSSNTATVTITVSAVNDAPVVATPLTDRSVTLGSSLNFSFGSTAFTDVETANLSYTATRADGSALPAWLSFNAGTRTFSGTPASGDIGILSVKVTASDGSLSASDTFDVVVSQRPNTAPVAANATGSTSEDTALTASLPTAADGESDPVTYAKATNPSHGTATVTSGGSYIYTPTANYNGPDSFTYTVSDGQGGSNTYTMSLTVNAVNDAPVATGGSLSTAEDTQATGTLAATDVDSTTLTYSLVTQPAKGTVTLGANGGYTYTPAKDVNGSDSFTFRASDGALSSNTATVSISIATVNDAPVVALPLPDQNTLAGSAFGYTFPGNAFTDVDNAVLTYSAALSTGASLPAWLSFNPATRTFSGTPSTTNAGNIDVRVTASDGSLSASDVFSIAVSDRPSATSYSPADGAKAVAVGSNLLVTFNGPVQRGTGAITLKSADGKVVETFTASNATVSGSTLTLNPTADLSIFTKYVVELGAGAIKDAAGNGNAADSRYDFQTATQDGLYNFFVVAFAAAPGATYMGQLAEAVNAGLGLQQIVEIFTTKTQFTSVYPTTMSNRELATQLVNNIVNNSASTATKQAAIDDIDAALGIGWSRGKMLYTVFGNLASKPLSDATWGSTAKQFQNQLAVARYFTEEMGVATENLATLRAVIGSVTPDSDVSTVDKIVQIIGTIPPGG
jgi:VCBS repeat-containing protein